MVIGRSAVWDGGMVAHSVIRCLTSLVLFTMPPKNSHSGGRQIEPLVEKHFTPVGQRDPKTKRYKMTCNYCPPGTSPIEHRDRRCVYHLSKYEECPNTPEEVRKEALMLLAAEAAAGGSGTDGDPDLSCTQAHTSHESHCRPRDIRGGPYRRR